ncbi:MAG: hypothetical protein RL689_1606 [Planctomycetota bacterium]
MARTLGCILAASMLALTSGASHGVAADPDPGPGAKHVACDLLLPSRQLAAGTTTIIGVRFRIADEWHLYWNGQNDSGAAPTLDFSGSDPRLTFGAARWPVPTRHVAEGDIVDHIYERECVMLVPLTVAKGVEGDVTISLRSEILVCREACLPGRVGATATVRLGAEAGEPTGAAALAKAEAALPREMKGPMPFDWRMEGSSLIVEAKSGQRLRRLTFMPGPGCEATTLQPGCESRSEGGSVPRLEVALASKQAKGIIQCEDESGGVTSWNLDGTPPAAASSSPGASKESGSR